MLQKFIKNIALVLFLNLLIKPFWILGIDRSVQNAVGIDNYGFYYAIINFTFLLNILLDFGITNFNNKNIAQNNHLLRKHLSNIIVLKLILGFVYLIISLICGLLIGYSSQQVFVLIILSFNQFLISFVLYLRSNLSGMHLFKTDSMISVLDRLIMIIVCSILLWGKLPITFSIRWYVFAQTFAYALTALITLIIVFKKAKTKFLKMSWNLPFSIMIIKNSYPFAILVLLMAFYNRIDTVMIERMLPDPIGSRQSGIYASAYRLLDATNMIAYLFAALLLPIFSKMLKHKDSVEDLVKFSFTLLYIPAVIISIGSFFYRYELMGMLYNEHIEASAEVFGFLMTCFVPIATTYIFGTLLTANGNLKFLNIVAASGMVINISLNLFLIPKFFAVGSAYASLTTQFITSIVQVLIVQKLFKFKLNYFFLFRLIIFTLGVLLINYFTFEIFKDWKINFAIMLILSGVFSLLIRLLDVKNIIKIAKYGE
ncbi:MAG: oligosaccharide flippase family protein [Bacteroidetes bacterium]|nr:oligosaccharide flippase family protein [Bacteroidota bacterium]